MQKWEYVVVENMSAEDLNWYGEAGWELISVTFNDFGVSKFFYFKRPKP